MCQAELELKDLNIFRAIQAGNAKGSPLLSSNAAAQALGIDAAMAHRAERCRGRAAAIFAQLMAQS